MFKWKKLGVVFNPVEMSNFNWMRGFAQGPAVLVFDEFIRVYFSCRPAPDANGQYVSYTAFVDLDRGNFKNIIRISEKPILELGGSGTFDEFGVYPASVIRNNDKVLAYYGGWTRCESVPFNVAIGLAISEDGGVTFHRAFPGPVLSYSIDEPFILSGPKIRRFNDLWYLFYIAGRAWILDNGKPEPVYKIRMATSRDGLTWEKQGKDLIEDKIGVNEAQASPDVIFSNGKYHMFFCFRHGKAYRGKEGGYRIGYAHSEDLVHWTRNDERAGIDVSEEGWDSEMISYPHVFNLDGNTYMFYLGNHVGRFGFGAAILEGPLA